MELKPFKVSEINQYIKRILSSDPILYNIAVEGEISNFKEYNNGNTYFTLKDDKSKIKCVYFNDMNNKLPLIIEDGMHVTIRGYISVYERDGVYQIYVRNIEKKGVGELFEAFEKLKKKLQIEGLFRSENKKPLSFFPNKVGVVTSPKGAAIRDIISVINRRMPSVSIIIYPVLVQGEKAPKDICEAIKYFNTREDIDTIIVGRGGGSIEELWAFNHESVAREIYKSNIPIISAVGHETDFTIADFVADMRAPTPSVAGEIAVPQIEELNFRLSSILNSLIKQYGIYIDTNKSKLKNINDKFMVNNPINILNDSKQGLDNTLKDLIRIFDGRKDRERKKIDFLSTKLDALSPLAILSRGYSLATDVTGKIIKSVEEISTGDILSLIFHDGEVEIKVIRK